MKILREFHVINKDGVYELGYTFNETDNEGEYTKVNAKKSFCVLDEKLKGQIDDIEKYIAENKLG